MSYILDKQRLEVLACADETQRYSGDLVSEMSNKILQLESFLAARDQDLNEAILELSHLKEKHRWIPVSERLPEEDGYYLCLDEERKEQVYSFEGAGWWWNDYGYSNCRDTYVSHWQPLPEPPESEGK